MGVVILICLAVYRVTHFITQDAFPPIAMFREYIELRFGDGSTWAYLVGCSWCVSIYVGAAAVAGLLAADVSIPLPGLVWLASSAVTGLISTVEDLITSHTSRGADADAQA